MTMTPTVTHVAEFSEPGSSALPWSEAERVLVESEMFWLSTVRADGRPHVAPLPAMWVDGRAHFCTGAHEQKAVNLAVHPSCALTTGTSTYRAGIDLVIEGTAAITRDEELLGELAALWRSKLDWTFEVRGGAFTDPAQGTVAPVYALTPVKILAFTKAPYSQTRYTF
ncbi:pyridoxamine 5'-phosphate oxidase family protein [Catenuloplanes atrovinosus]|uniref:General stress protein 26 n=1 Tax=Catenuloplanes atrovinosus TaxID=137266 RepID=A0AAE3YHU0_9ACTN|nr:pyridoxamine 5'-phosphate oxidase family protein [Catenuloplanes atrovinosus]MDR7273949.1 general stress protein 26 [Catenuloplanes atrovinosus]